MYIPCHPQHAHTICNTTHTGPHIMHSTHSCWMPLWTREVLSQCLVAWHHRPDSSSQLPYTLMAVPIEIHSSETQTHVRWGCCGCAPHRGNPNMTGDLCGTNEWMNSSIRFTETLIDSVCWLVELGCSSLVCMNVIVADFSKTTCHITIPQRRSREEAITHINYTLPQAECMWHT